MTLSNVRTQAGTDFSDSHNQVNMDRIKAAITQINTNDSDIATNVADIATNVADIATNAADIVTNASAIALRMESTGHVAAATVLMGTQPTAADTLTIGADVYELDGAGANINVALGIDVAATRAALIVAINTLGTEAVLASAATLPSAGIMIQAAAAAGGAVVIGAGANIALSESLSPVADVWMNTNTNETGEVAYTDKTQGRLLCNSTNIATGSATVIPLPFTPLKVSWEARDTSDDPKATTATVAISGDAIVITPGAGGTALVATDYVDWIAHG